MYALLYVCIVASKCLFWQPCRSRIATTDPHITTDSWTSDQVDGGLLDNDRCLPYGMDVAEAEKSILEFRLVGVPAFVWTSCSAAS
jgi:hypothetical protein